MKRVIILLGAAFWLMIALIGVSVLVHYGSGAATPRWLAWVPDVRDLNINWSWDGKDGGFVLFGDEVTLRSEENYDLAEAGTVTLEAHYQSVWVRITDGKELAVRHYDHEDSAEMTHSLNGGTLSLRIPQRSFVSLFSLNFSSNGPRLELDIPRSYAGKLSLQTSSGSVRIYDKGEWEELGVTTSSGSQNFEQGVKAKAVRLRASSGSIRSEGLEGDIITVNTSSGSIHTGTLRGGEVAVSASSGSVNTGDADCAQFTGGTSSGSQHYGRIHATGWVKLGVTSGSMNISGLSAEEFDVQSSSGSLRLNGTTQGCGSVRSTSGGVTIEHFVMQGNTRVSASSGSVRIGMASGQGYRVEASASSGSIRVNGTKTNKNYSDTVGDGSAGLLDISTTSGSIFVE